MIQPSGICAPTTRMLGRLAGLACSRVRERYSAMPGAAAGSRRQRIRKPASRGEQTDASALLPRPCAGTARCTFFSSHAVASCAEEFDPPAHPHKLTRPRHCLPYPCAYRPCANWLTASWHTPSNPHASWRAVDPQHGLTCHHRSPMPHIEARCAVLQRGCGQPQRCTPQPLILAEGPPQRLWGRGGEGGEWVGYCKWGA